MSTQTRRDRRRTNLSGQTFPKVNVILRFNMKYVDGKSVFQFWDADKGDKGENVSTTKPMKGILIGTAMNVVGYDRVNEKFYRSSPFLKNENQVVLFANGERDKNFRGDVVSAKGYLAGKGIANSGTKISYYVLTESGLFSVETNISIAIQQQRDIKKEKGQDIFIDNYIILTPDRYDPDDNEKFDKVTHKNLKITKQNKNYPCFANISVGEEISDEIFEKWNEEDATNEYSEWKKFVNKAKEIQDEDADAENEEAVTNEDEPDHEDNIIEEEDDLPF